MHVLATMGSRRGIGGRRREERRYGQNVLDVADGVRRGAGRRDCHHVDGCDSLRQSGTCTGRKERNIRPRWKYT